MNLQKTNKIIKQSQKLLIEENNYLQILKRLKIIIIKMKNLDISAVIYKYIVRDCKKLKKKKKPENVINMTK